jgi:hypothetical protein
MLIVCPKKKLKLRFLIFGIVREIFVDPEQHLIDAYQQLGFLPDFNVYDTIIEDSQGNSYLGDVEREMSTFEQNCLILLKKRTDLNKIE